ncbi:pilus assembly protein TadB [Vibrio sp. HI00D65]|uniref:type II secretion system F family protein n=1 Tax=Vibrio sp. HI00D65 TaxID=1822216 RepID=UPI0007BACD7B|nr:pilus assembly protein TadB [Vibrio sp. HI00D65]
MILVLVVLSTLLSLLLLRRRARHANVNKRLQLVSCQQQASSISIKKDDHIRSNKLYALFRRINALLCTSDKGFIILTAIGFPIASHAFLPKVALYYQVIAVAGLWLTCFFALVFYRRKLQVEEFEKSIISVLGLISRAVSAGLSVPQAIDQVAQNEQGLLGREFSYIRDNLALGLSLRDTLEDACIRLPYHSFRYFSVALILNQSNGGQLRDILQGLSRTMHDNRAMRKKVKSLTSEPRMTALFLSLLPIGLIGSIAWIEPIMADRLINTESGQNVLIYVLSSICFGTLILNSLTRNKRFSS